MIGFLKGIPIHQTASELWLDVNGVGYRIKYNSKLSMNHEPRTTNLELYIHTAVREDAITLYGFNTLDELNLFELLITVSGIGPKTASQIVIKAPADKIQFAISNADVKYFSTLPGIGKKTAERMIVELKSKIGSLKELDLASEAGDDPIFDALKGFGFKPNHIAEVLKKLDPSLPENDRLRLALKQLGKVK